MKTMHEIKNLYGKEYVEHFEKSQSPSRLERLIPYIDIKPHHNVADFACGSGMLMAHIAPLVSSYIGVDFSEPFIIAANSKKEALGLNNVRFECSSIQEFCAGHLGEFDVGFAMDFAEHVYNEEWLDILRSMRGSLNKDGRLYLHTPNARFVLEIMKHYNFITKQFPDHIAVRTQEENVHLLKLAGFRVNKVLLLPHYNALRYAAFFNQ